MAGWNPASSLRVLEESVAGTRGRRYRIEISLQPQGDQTPRTRRLRAGRFHDSRSGRQSEAPRVVKLRGMRDVWRMREGQMRVIFRIVASSSLVVILRVVMRSERTYRGL